MEMRNLFLRILWMVSEAIACLHSIDQNVRRRKPAAEWCSTRRRLRVSGHHRAIEAVKLASPGLQYPHARLDLDPPLLLLCSEGATGMMVVSVLPSKLHGSRKASGYR